MTETGDRVTSRDEAAKDFEKEDHMDEVKRIASVVLNAARS